MAHHASAKKRIRQTEKRRLRNRSVMSEMKTNVKKLTEALESGNLENVDALFCNAQSEIATARRKGLIHKNNMARRISRLAAKVNKAKAAVAQ